MGYKISLDLTKGRYLVAPLAMAALFGMACSSNNNANNNSASNTAANTSANTAATQAAATRAATSAPAAAGSPAAPRAATPVAASPAAARPASPAAGSPAAARPAGASPAAAGAVTTTSPAADLRVTIDRLLSEHADLAIVAMQKGYDGAPDFAMTAAQLDKNTSDLSAAIASVYGADAGTKFQALWKAHIGMFVDFTTATAAKDTAKRDKALADLSNYRKDFAAFINGANPNLPADAVAGLLQTHVQELTDALDAYAAKDYAKAYSMFDAAHTHMFMTGDALAGGIVKQSPDKFAGNPATKAADLRVTIDRLLSEHADLAIIAMQKGVAGAPDFMAAATQLDKNTSDLSAAIASVYGADAGTKFQALWKAHIGMFVDYTTGTAAKDQAKKDKALADLSNYRKDFGAFINGANPNLPADAVAGLLQTHVNELIGAFDSYVAKDYTKTYQQFDESYAHMFMTGDALAAGIVKQSPEKFAALLTPGDANSSFAAVVNEVGYSYACTINLEPGNGITA